MPARSGHKLSVPVGALSDLSATRCLRALERSGLAFERVGRDTAPGVSIPIRVKGDIGGVLFRGGRRRSHQGVLDCRLALALLAWAPQLRAAGVGSLEHYSVYRPGARVASNGRRSGHASALAIDAARFHFRDGRVLTVLEDWTERTRGAQPCAERASESRSSRTLRSLVCGAVERGLFQVVITPHHDAAHANHVHLELRPGVDWTFVR